MVVLYERAPSLAALVADWRRAGSGHGGTVLVEGPAGIGKSSVIEAHRAACCETVALVARGTPAAASATGAVPRDWFGPLLRRTPVGTPPFDGPAARFVETDLAPGDLAWAVRWILDDLTACGPVLAIVDDVQWVDAASLGLLEQLVAAARDLPLLLVLGRRTGEPSADDQQLARIRRRARVETLAPLSPDAARELCGDLGRDLALDPATQSALVARAGGNPFFLTELVQAHRQGVSGVPDGARELVAELLSRLPERAADVALMLAVLHDHARPDLVAAMLDVEEAEVVDAGSLLAGAGLVEPGTLRPAHGLVAEAVLSGVSATRRAQLHRAAATALAEAGAADATVAAHLLLTAPARDEAVRTQLTAAGLRAEQAGAHALASAYLSRAVAESADPGVELLRSAARAAAACGETDRALDLWRRAAHAARGADGEEAALLLAEAGDALLAVGRLPEATELWEDQLTRLDPGSEAGKRIAARIALGVSVITGVPRAFTDSLTEILGRDPATDSPGDRLVLSAAAIGAVFSGTGSAAEVRMLSERGWGGGLLLAEETAAGSPLYLVTAGLNWCDAFDLGLEVLDAAVRQAREMDTETLGTAAYCRGYVRLRAGHVNGAVDDLELAMAMRELGWDAYTPALLQLACETYLYRGELDAARRVTEQLVANEHGDKVFYAAYRALGMAQLAVAEGRYDDALEAVEPLRESPMGINQAIVDWRGLRVRTLAAMGRVDDARVEAGDVIASAREYGAPRLLAGSLVTAAAVGAAGADALHEALALTEDTEVRRTRERTEAMLLLAERSTGDQAVRYARDALDRAHEEGLVPWRERATAVLARHGSDPAPATGPLDVLTPAERRVVEAVLAGRTNREAAAHLYLSVKAVEWHLSSTYRKLGVRGRPELAALVAG